MLNNYQDLFSESPIFLNNLWSFQRGKNLLYTKFYFFYYNPQLQVKNFFQGILYFYQIWLRWVFHLYYLMARLIDVKNSHYFRLERNMHIYLAPSWMQK